MESGVCGRSLSISFPSDLNLDVAGPWNLNPCLIPSCFCSGVAAAIRGMKRKRGRKRHVAAAQIKELGDLFRKGVPKILTHVLLAMSMSPLITLSLDRDLDAAELFAGSATWSEAMEKAGFRVASYDVEMADAMNILTAVGFGCALLLLTRIRQGGICMMAPVCSSWTFMARSTSGRSIGDPLGKTERQFVYEGNMMVSRCCLLILFLHARGVCWALEQPASTLLHLHPRFQALLRRRDIAVYRVYFHMGALGGSSEKPTYLFTSADWLSRFQSYKVKKKAEKQTLAKHYIDASGKKRSSGTSELKASAAYPRGFGEMFAKLVEAIGCVSFPRSCVPRLGAIGAVCCMA